MCYAPIASAFCDQWQMSHILQTRFAKLHVHAILAPALDVRALLAFRSYTKTQAGEVTRHMPLLPPIVLVLLVISSLLVVLLLLLRLRRSSCHDHAQRQTPSHRRAALTPTVRSHVLQRTQVHALAREI